MSQPAKRVARIGLRCVVSEAMRGQLPTVAALAGFVATAPFLAVYFAGLGALAMTLLRLEFNSQRPSLPQVRLS